MCKGTQAALESNENFENEERRRPESTLNNDKLRKAVESNPRTTVKKLAKKLDISRRTDFCHFKWIEKTKKFGKWDLTN
uniref:HTH_48 domain-containing protein n=1 Tax=Strongyloides papillosus TaxID=174720 RepID=A0A0N5CE32_STREA